MIGSAGAVSSKWVAASLLARNAGTESKPETNEATSMAAMVPAGSAVEAMMSVSNFGPATSFNRVACGTAATMTAALPALLAASAANRLPISVAAASPGVVEPLTGVGVSGVTPLNKPAGAAAVPAFAENIW